MVENPCENNIVKSIKSFAFINREDITDVNIPNGTKIIGERAYSKCKNIKTLVIPNTVTTIEASAFSGCENIEEVILPNSVKTIGYRAFADCKRLKRIVIPEGVEKIEWACFSGCENLEEIVLPKSLKSIDKQLFLNCKKLKTVTIPPNIESLPDEFFKGCNKLDIVLNKNITKLGNRVFEDCYKLSNYPTHIKVAGNNCFKNCRNIKNVVLNEAIDKLPDGFFDGCTNLKNITQQKTKLIEIGKRCFRNCKSLDNIPSFVKNYNELAFENCTGFTEITITQENIPKGCFRGCKNIHKINNESKIHNLESFAFSGCDSLEEINILNAKTIEAEAFSNCKKLKTVNLSMNLKTIGARAFYNCSLLKNFSIPDSVIKIGKEALKYCHSISCIRIPSQLKLYGNAAFSYMDSLERIEVSPQNETYITPDNKVLIHKKWQRLMLYASGLKDKSYSLKSYNLEYDELRRAFVKPIIGIHKFAFAGTKNLEELNICCCTSDVEHTAFYDCPNLKVLKIHPIPFYTNAIIKLRINNKYYFEDIAKTKPQIPFTTVEFCEGEDDSHLTQIDKNALPKFNNVTKIILPKIHKYSISEGAFKDCKKLEIAFIPNNVINIYENAFPKTTKLKFENGLELNGSVKLSYHDKYIGEYKLYTLEDEAFYIEQNNKITKLTKKQIDDVCSYSEEIRDNPILYLDFMNDLLNHDLGIKYLFNGILFSTMSLENRQIFYNNFNKKDTFFLNVLKHSKIFEEKDKNTKYLLEDQNFSKVVKYIDLLKSKNLKDRYLYKKHFMANVDEKLLLKLLDVYDTNTKRLLKLSCIENNSNSSAQNLQDLLVLMDITGALEKDPITRQRASTFISEKIFADILPNGNNNEFRIVGDDIHRIFNFPYTRYVMYDDFDNEFAEFFLENYQQLVKEEKIKSGFIQRVYLNFSEISKTCTSNKGSQRHLKVTIDKCKNYLLTTKFDNVSEELKDLAELIGAWYDHNDVWLNAQKVYNESLNAPRNIFTTITYDKDGTPIYDINPENDLRETTNTEYSYEWLPKQEYDNLILGKYCNCCAHIDGAGQGIMRASMILDCCQNLVIRNENGEIIAKSTIFINREENYGVFNNVETSLNHRSNEELEKIYETFIRGSKAFFETYNQNNPNKPLNNISIGATRNTILPFLTDEKHPSVNIQKALNYGTYSIGSYHYDGDWKNNQRLVLKK